MDATIFKIEACISNLSIEANTGSDMDGNYIEIALVYNGKVISTDKVYVEDL